MTEQDISIVCVNTDTKYPPEYVYKLHQMVQRYVTIPHQFICFAGNPALYKNAPFDVEQEPTGYHGWWAKIGIFKQNKAMNSKVLYLDLDVVLQCNIDHYFDRSGFWTIQDWQNDCFNSSVLLFDAPDYHYIYEECTWRERGIYKTDQHYLTAKIKHPHFFSRQEVVSYKLDHCESSPPPDADIIVFHGYPKPEHCDGWVEQAWGGKG